MAEKSIELDSVEIAAAVFGNCDRNIRLLEKEFSVTAVCRGTMLRLSGEAAIPGVRCFPFGGGQPMLRQRPGRWRGCCS